MDRIEGRMKNGRKDKMVTEKSAAAPKWSLLRGPAPTIFNGSTRFLWEYRATSTRQHIEASPFGHSIRFLLLIFFVTIVMVHAYKLAKQSHRGKNQARRAVHHLPRFEQHQSKSLGYAIRLIFLAYLLKLQQLILCRY